MVKFKKSKRVDIITKINLKNKSEQSVKYFKKHEKVILIVLITIYRFLTRMSCSQSCQRRGINRQVEIIIFSIPLMKGSV